VAYALQWLMCADCSIVNGANFRVVGDYVNITKIAIRWDLQPEKINKRHVKILYHVQQTNYVWLVGCL